MVTKVLIVDDSSFFRRRISDILSSDPDIEIVGQAVDGIEAVEKTSVVAIKYIGGMLNE